MCESAARGLCFRQGGETEKVNYAGAIKSFITRAVIGIRWASSRGLIFLRACLVADLRGGGVYGGREGRPCDDVETWLRGARADELHDVLM